MTGGTPKAGIINQRLAEAAQAAGIAMGVGSQRAALESHALSDTFAIARRAAPNILLFANLGAIQLNHGFTLDHCRRAVDMVRADALILHLNPLQEVLQEDGNTLFGGLANKIEQVCRALEVPIIAKEVGWGISARTAQILADCGVKMIDVAGAGGTSWSQVEMHRAPDDFVRSLAASFSAWGIPTAESIEIVGRSLPHMPIIASGGLRDGIDIAKCIALGATMAGMAGKFLRAASVSGSAITDLIGLTIKQLRIVMFCLGINRLDRLRKTSALVKRHYLELGD
jgi:isopentenyl-diphosphate delta-isomerase